MCICSTDYDMVRRDQYEDVTLDLTAPKDTLLFHVIERYIMDRYPTPCKNLHLDIGYGENENKLIVSGKPNDIVAWLKFMSCNYEFSPWHVRILSTLAKEDPRRKIILKEQTVTVVGKYVTGGSQEVPWFESPWEINSINFTMCRF